MASRFIRRPFYGLAELCDYWAIPKEAIASYVLERELTLSIAVAAVHVEAGYDDEDARGHHYTVPAGQRWITGTMDLHCINAWTILKQGDQRVRRFHDPSGEFLDVIDHNGETDSLVVERDALVVRHAERERFEAAQGITNATGQAPEGSRLTGTKSRGAPPKYNWEDFWCYMLLYIHCPGPPSTQTELLHVSREWFADRLGPDAVPCDSSIKSRLNKFWPDVKPNVGRPSAATAIR